MKTNPLKLLTTLIRTHRPIFFVLVLSFALAVVWDSGSKQESIEAKIVDSSTLDTLIPEGFSLVNIEIVNADKLDAILGQFGIVDLYLANEDGKRTTKKIASKVKILRAPKNPQEFAVLVLEAQVSELFAYNSPFFASIQNPGPNPTNRETNFEKRSLKVSRITTE